MSAPPIETPGVIIFDLDGTLVDVERSFRAAVPIAASRYLDLLGIPAPAIPRRVIDHFKRIGGFNDDWDLTAALLELIVGTLPPAPPLPPGSITTQTDLLSALRASAGALAGLAPSLPAMESLVEPARRAGGGPAGLRAAAGSRNAHLVWRTGDARTTDLVQRIFAELYLGESLFERCYGVPACFHVGPGMIELEEAMVSPAALAALAARARLGIATGRTRFDTDYTLRFLGLQSYFPAIATMDDALATPGGRQMLKPHPYLLELAADRLDPGRELAAAYVGDMPDDIVAAVRANGSRRWLAVGVVSSHDAELRAHYEALGAGLIITAPDELAQIWSPLVGALPLL